jgi:hypothetical protein
MNYTWNSATGSDVTAIVNMAVTHFQNEIDLVFNPQPLAYSRNITHAIVNQFYAPGSELVSVAKDDTGRLLAYTWARANEHAHWSDDAMVSVCMAHVDLTISPRSRVRLIKDMLALWERFAQLANNKIICSTTMRHEQDAFLKLHASAGYSVRGSFAYKLVTPTQAVPAN